MAHIRARHRLHVATYQSLSRAQYGELAVSSDTHFYVAYVSAIPTLAKSTGAEPEAMPGPESQPLEERRLCLHPDTHYGLTLNIPLHTNPRWSA